MNNNRIDLYQAFALDGRESPERLGRQLTDRLNMADPADALLRHQITTARAILSDPQRRAGYDRMLADPQATLGPADLDRIAAQPLGGGTQVDPPAPHRGAGPGPQGWSAKRRYLVGGLLGTLGLIIGVTVFAVQGGGPGTTASGCADVVFIGAAGSGQRDGGNLGVGKIVADTYANLHVDATAAGMTTELREVVYPATSVPVSFSVEKWQEFLGSVTTGADAATDVISTTISECHDSKIVVGGYSQGAMAIHRALHRVGPNEQIVGGVLIGDGDKVAGDNVTTIPLFGTDSLEGVGQVFAGQSGASAQKFPASWEDKLISPCKDGDVVCAFSSFSIGQARAHISYDAEAWRDFLQERVTG